MSVYIYHVRATQKRTSLEYVFFFLSRLMLDVFGRFFFSVPPPSNGNPFSHTYMNHIETISLDLVQMVLCAVAKNSFTRTTIVCVVRTLNISGHSYKYMYFTMKDL